MHKITQRGFGFWFWASLWLHIWTQQGTKSNMYSMDVVPSDNPYLNFSHTCSWVVLGQRRLMTWSFWNVATRRKIFYSLTHFFLILISLCGVDAVLPSDASETCTGGPLATLSCLLMWQRASMDICLFVCLRWPCDDLVTFSRVQHRRQP